MPDTTDIVLRTVAVMAAVLLGSLLLAIRRRRPAALPGAMLSFAIAAFFLTSIPGGGPALGPWGYGLTALCVTKAAWFWLFALTLFRDDATVSAGQLGIVASVAAAGTWQQTVFLPAFRADAAGSLESFAGFGFEAMLALFVVLGLREAWRDLEVDLVERRRRLRVGFIAATGAYLAVTLVVQVHNVLLDTTTPLIVSRANMAIVAIASVAAAWMLLRVRRVTWLEPVRSEPIVALNRGEAAVLRRLERSLEAERIYLREGLTIGSLASHIGSSEHTLRHVINRGMGYRNFNDFLHAHRIREACSELAKPEQARRPVLEIAMKVGYGSIGAFNRAFKARIGMTPTDFRRKSLSEAAVAR
jgi:AraC-like DNA-binding protein